MATALGIGRIEINEDYLREVAKSLKDLGEDAPEVANAGDLAGANNQKILDVARKFVESQTATKEE
jgi:hypothetical protein